MHKEERKEMSIMDPDIEVMRKIDGVLLQSSLSAKARREADVIAREVFAKYLFTRYREPRLDEYPATVVSCAQNDACFYTEKTNHDVPREYIIEDLLERLEGRLERKYGCESKLVKKILIGHCAEPLAANELLKHENVKDIDDIYFGDAYRPRTGTVIPPCANCRKVFNNVIIRDENV